MDYEMTMLGLAVALPAAAPITSYIKQSSIRVFAAVFFCGCIMLNSWLLFFAGNIFASVRNLYIFVAAFNFAILGYCIYIAFKRKSFFVFMSAVLEAALMCWFLIHKKYAPGNSTVVIVDTLSKLFVFAVSSAGSVFALLWSKYADERSHKHNMKLFRIIFFCIAAVNFAAVSGNLFFFPLAINIIGLAVYSSMAEEKGLEMHEGSVLALKYFLSASLIFFAAVCFLYSYNGGSDGLSIVLLLKMGGLKSAGKISIAVIMLYISAFICAALPPFHRWASPASSAFFQASLVCICSIPLGLFLIFRLAPVFPLLAYSGKASGMIIGYSAALFGSFAFFSCSALSCIKKDIMQACPYFLSGIGGIICACAGTGIPAAVSGGFFLFCFAYAFCCIMILCQFVPDDPCCSFIRKITAISLYMPPFGVFFALWIILEAFFNASVIIPGSGLTVFTSSVLPLSAAFFTVIGIALSLISWTAKGASSPSYMPLEKIRPSGLSVSVMCVLGFSLLLNFVLPALYYVVKKASVDAMSPDASEPGVIVSMLETGFAGGGQSLSGVFSGLYPSVIMASLFIASALFFCVFCNKRNNYSDVSERIFAAWNRLFSGRHARFLSERYLESFFTPASFVMLAYLLGVSSGITFR